jgi:very-short-patch-repair endonuclease
MSAKYKRNPKITQNNIASWKDPIIRQKRIDGIIKKFHKGYNPIEYYFDFIKPLIYQGLTLSQISKKSIFSLPTIQKFVLEYGNSGDMDKTKENAKHAKSLVGQSKKGKPSPLKGKTYSEILGSDELAKKRSQITSDWMKRNNIRKYCTKISKPQKMLFDIIKEKYPNAIIEYNGIKTPDGRTLWLDIAIVEEKINIEYDGIYWHDKNNKKRTQKSKWSDTKRDEYLKSIGWTVFRFQFYHNPEEKELVDLAKEYSIIK